jgi:hypothetical protein
MTTQLTHSDATARTAEPAIRIGLGWLREAFHRIHLAIQEMNYASRRVVEVQAPWFADNQPHRR